MYTVIIVANISPENDSAVIHCGDYEHAFYTASDPHEYVDFDLGPEAYAIVMENNKYMETHYVNRLD